MISRIASEVIGHNKLLVDKVMHFCEERLSELSKRWLALQSNQTKASDLSQTISIDFLSLNPIIEGESKKLLMNSDLGRLIARMSKLHYFDMRILEDPYE